jgi:hypothetical protein
MMLRQPRTPEREQAVAQAIQDAIKAANAQKPSDRSELDSAYAVTITQLEMALGYFTTYAIAVPMALAHQEQP